MVALIPVPVGTRLDDLADDRAFVMAIPADARIDDDGVRALAAELDTVNADACFGDLTVKGIRVRRAAWSPTRLIGDPAFSSPLAVRTSWLRDHGVEVDDPALGLELAAANAVVAYLPQVLSHHQSPPPIASLSEVQDHVTALGLPAIVRAADGGYELTAADGFAPAVTVIIPSAGTRYPDGTPAIERLLDSLGVLPPNVQVLLVIGDEFSLDAGPLEARAGVSILHRPPGPFNFAAAVNLGIRAARDDLILLLNDDMESTGAEFTYAMALHLADPHVGAVGGLLTYPDGTVQHAGVIIDDARPLHPFVGGQLDDAATHGACTARDVAAVTGGCLMARRRDLLAVGGLSVGFPLSFNDIDLCVRLRRTGFRVIIEPAARLVHHETLSRSPVIEAHEWDRWIDRWGEIVDPWYHPDWHRPDDPEALARNADHLPPLDGDASSGALRLPVLTSQVHRGRAVNPST